MWGTSRVANEDEILNIHWTKILSRCLYSFASFEGALGRPGFNIKLKTLHFQTIAFHYSFSYNRHIRK